jgi:hypothetical protein
MMTDEDRHADEVNIAFQMGAEWQKKQSDSAWKGIHEGSVLAMQAHIERFETALNADEQTIRLALGELSAQDMRNIRAAFNWVLSQAKGKKA